MRVLFTILLACILCGCRTVSKTNLNTDNTQVTVSARLGPDGNYHEDLWDFYWKAIEAGKCVFTWPKTIIVYLVSNVQVFDTRPEVTDMDFVDRVGVVVIIFRWSW